MARLSAFTPTNDAVAAAAAAAAAAYMISLPRHARVSLVSQFNVGNVGNP